MRTTQLLLLLLCLHSVISAQQYATFPTPGLELGSIYTCIAFGCPSFKNYSERYIGDEMACGKNWARFEPRLGRIRVEKGRYFRQFVCTQEDLLYDFSKEVGDSVKVFDEYFPLIVIAVDSMMIANGTYRKKMTLKSSYPPDTRLFTWVDGIGDINNGFTRNRNGEGGFERLVCVRDSSGLLYHNPNWPLNCDSLLCKVPEPKFEFSCSGQIFEFLNLSENADAYLWDFGDGETSVEKYPTHTYSEDGCFQVTLTTTTHCLPLEYKTSKNVTVNARVNWKKTANQPPENFKKIQFLDENNGWALGENTIYKTTNGGQLWDTVPYPGPLMQVTNLQFSDFEHGIVSIRKPGPNYDDGILWTNDGINWIIDTTTYFFYITRIERVNDSVAIVARIYSLFITKDWGQTWTYKSLLNDMTFITDIFSVGGDTVYITGEKQSPPLQNKFAFGKSYDLLHWEMVDTQIPGNTAASSLFFLNAQKGWVSNGGNIYHTNNGGKSWVPQAVTPYFVYSIEFADSLQGWACGFNTGVYGTNDGGQTWRQQFCSRREEEIRTLTAPIHDRAFAMTDDGMFEYTTTPVVVNKCGTTHVNNPIQNPQTSFEIFPNPSSDQLTFAWAAAPDPDLRLILFNAQGMIALKWNPLEKMSVSVTHLAPGFYFLKAMTDQGTLLGSKKIVIAR